MEPFWDLKIGIIYVEYLMHVSSEYITSWVLLSLISTASQTSRILLADVIPWINKASLVLYNIARTLRNQPDVQKLYGAVEFVSCDWNLSLLRLRVGLRLHLRDWGTGIDVACRLCMYALYWRPFTLCSYWGCGQVFIYNIQLSCTHALHLTYYSHSLKIYAPER